LVSQNCIFFHCVVDAIAMAAMNSGNVTADGNMIAILD